VAPDASGNIKGITVPAEAWERIFGADKWHCLNCGGLRTPAAPNSSEDEREGRRCKCNLDDWQPGRCDCGCHDPDWIGTPGCWCSCTGR
jgi:hypothetical protein